MPLIVCIGNELVADDAVGFEVHARLEQVLPPEIRLAYCAVGGIALLDLLDGTEDVMVIVDAVSLGSPVGTVHRIPLAELPMAQGNPISAHGVGLRETIEIGAALYPERMPRLVTLIGVEGRRFDLSREHMTREVVEAIEPAVRAALSLVNIE